MKGNITRRGKSSWRLKFDAGRDADGKRKVQLVTVRGSKREAQAKLNALLASVGVGVFVEPSKLAVADFVRDRITQWEASGDISARTAVRYRELLDNQIVPHIGGKAVQKLKPLDVEQWHVALRSTGIAARTIGHAHRVLGKALRDAERNEVIHRNVAKTTRAPKVGKTEMTIVKDVPGLVDKLKGTTRLHLPAMIALFTGMRLGEILALRWNRVSLVERRVVQVVEAVEYTKAGGFRFKQPKSDAGLRDITLPSILVEALRDHRRAQLELRMQLGVGRMPDDALLFTDLDGNVPTPNSVSAAWHDAAKGLGVPGVTFHALRLPTPHS